MLRKALLLSWSVVLCLWAAGCGSGVTAAEVAESYGVLNGWNLQKRTADIIESGHADAMIDQGTAKVRHRVNRSGDSRVLVTEYLIQGQVYRVEVRRAINPTETIPWNELQYASLQRGQDEWTIAGLKLLSVWDTLKRDSYEAKPEVAYRAWRGLDGKIHDVVVREGEQPKWANHEGDVNLTIRTRLWPMTTMWVRGLAQDAPSSSAGIWRDDTDCGPRWILESPGPGDPDQEGRSSGRIFFINRKLAKSIGM